jgi:PIN domain nuclease of toxin-antitoxin system
MKLLLDSCVFLWLIDKHENIPPRIKQHISDPLNQIYLSSISVTEMIIKSGTGKLSMSKPCAKFIKNQRLINNILTLGLVEEDLVFLEKLPNIHADPFDRILICQAMANNMVIITPDKHIKSYPVNVLW